MIAVSTNLRPEGGNQKVPKRREIERIGKSVSSTAVQPSEGGKSPGINTSSHPGLLPSPTRPTQAQFNSRVSTIESDEAVLQCGISIRKR